MLDLKHGGHVLDVVEAKVEAAAAVAAKLEYRMANAKEETPFDYLFPQLEQSAEAHLAGAPADVVTNLKALGAAMVDAPPPDPALDSTIPAVYTYWGQFIDHDMTANTDRDSVTSDITKPNLEPVPPATVKQELKNLRRPTLDLDSLYGNGPDLPGCYHGRPDTGMYDGIKLRVGQNAEGPNVGGVKIPPVEDQARDLPRIGPLLDAGVITEDDIPESLRNDVNKNTRAFIGDLRNDENLIVAQFHLAFIRFHNNVVDAIEADPESFGLTAHTGAAKKFKTAQRLVRFHYQWLVVNDYLKTVTAAGVVDRILVGGNKTYKPLRYPGSNAKVLFAPLEYSVAAFRFGHTMVRGGYDFNRNFGKPVPPNAPQIPFAPFDLIFLFTGNGFAFDPADPTKALPNPFGGEPTLPFNWVIEWDRFSNKADPDKGRFARKVDTRLAPQILKMVNEGNAPAIQDDQNPANKPLRAMLRQLAQRNLLRGYLLSLPTGQAVAGALGVAPLTAAELQQGNSPEVNAALVAGGFIEHTPLWWYLLKEAEIRANGNSLGEAGSRIVAETIIGLVSFDPRSYLKTPGGWSPADGVRLANGDPIVTIRDFFAFAGLTA